jgi:3-oxoacyl-[acyl-carrier-protein] synthase II
MGAFTHYAIAASDQALADSGLQITPENAERVGTYSSSGLGDFWGTDKNWASLVPDKVDISSPDD